MDCLNCLEDTEQEHTDERFCNADCEETYYNQFSIKTEDDAREEYDQRLDECCPEWETPGGTPSQNMKDQDPTVYRCGFNDWIDTEIQKGSAPEEAQDWSAED